MAVRLAQVVGTGKVEQVGPRFVHIPFQCAIVMEPKPLKCAAQWGHYFMKGCIAYATQTSPIDRIGRDAHCYAGVRRNG